ncbi:SDR family NAD(P)-dependent oxidoreductase [Kribbella sp. NPDC058245]|uniref:SDR family NAD(P)-dependent oxidoreductase n=1 Tax=Kribbella sp. NPDC058245 TaxID=3346399 RepID=UPI0036E0B216
MDLGLQGKTAVVTGASRGIGLATAQALAAEGAQVVGVARTVTAEMKEACALVVSADLSGADGVQECADVVLEAFGRVDVLVNNVGGGDAPTLAPFVELTDDHWDEMFQLNLFAAVRLTRALVPSMIAAGGGSIVNVSSIGAWKPEGPPLAYNVSKAALRAFGIGLAGELGQHGIRVRNATPGPTRTAVWEGDRSLGAELARVTGAPQEAIVAGVPAQFGMATGRLVEPAEVASLIVYLASPRADSITGSDHLVDGGAIRLL